VTNSRRDFHPQVSAHAGRTKRRSPGGVVPGASGEGWFLLRLRTHRRREPRGGERSRGR
jgi:hypothetical protein